jgi:hypothetical protein
METLTQILASNSESNPHEIIVSYTRAERYQPDRSYEALLNRLETFILSLPAVPRLQWRLGYSSLDFKPHPVGFTDIVNLFHRAMPKLHVMGMVVVEKYKYDWRDDL